MNLGVDFDGTITWNNTAIDMATLLIPTSRARVTRPPEEQDEIHLNPNPLAKYDRVAKVLADAQRLDVHKIGFTGIEQYNQ